MKTHDRERVESVSQVQTPAGDLAWKVTRHAAVKALLADPRLGRSHPRPEEAAWYTKDNLSGRPLGDSEHESAEHAQWRRRLVSVFSMSATELLRSRVEAIINRLLDVLAQETPPIDFHREFSDPMATLVVCELLQVPYDDRNDFRRWAEDAADSKDIRRSSAGMARSLTYARALIRGRREEPREDVASQLIAGQGHIKAYEGKVTKLLADMIGQGRETPANVVDLGLMLLLTNPQQRAALQSDPSLAHHAVEEILRFFPPSSATPDGLVRYAHVDIEFGGITIRTGDMVLLDITGANRDPNVFREPDRFDIRREPNPHLTFGHGTFMCPASSLPRMELQLVFGRLFQRFPTLRLAVPREQLRFKNHLLTGGVVELPVDW